MLDDATRRPGYGWRSETPVGHEVSGGHGCACSLVVLARHDDPVRDQSSGMTRRSPTGSLASGKASVPAATHHSMRS